MVLSVRSSKAKLLLRLPLFSFGDLHGSFTASSVVATRSPLETLFRFTGTAAAVLPSRRSPLPMHVPHYFTPCRLLHSSHYQVPPILPRPFPPPHPQMPSPPLITRFLSSSSGDVPISSDSDSDPDRTADGHSPDVDRVSTIINELFASDRNMEAVLDECGVHIEKPVVIGVLDRFRHAHKPSYRFFRWSAARPGFAHDCETYNVMLTILGKTRQFETMVSMLEEMGKQKLLTIEAFKISIKAFASAREMKKSMGIFQLMKKFSFKADSETFNCLIDSLAKAKLGKEANALFAKMKDQYPPNLRTYTVLLFGWCKLKNLVEAARIWNEMIDNGFKPDIVAHNTMLEGLIRAQRRPEAIKMFGLMKTKGPKPNARSYTVLIHDMCKGGKMDNAVGCFEEMLAAGVAPDAATYTCLIVGFGNARRMDKVSGLLKEMEEKGCPPDGRTYNALIKLMTNRSMPDDAVRIYKRMIKNGFEPTIHTYNMMMKSYFHGNNYDMGCAVWEEMWKKGIGPDVNSYTVFIGGHIRHGRPEEAHKYIEEMINKGMNAPQIDYNKFAADFSRAGRPDVLYEMAQMMKFSGKFQVSNVFNHWAERMEKRVKKRLPNQTGHRLF
ncbi:putative tetratricopeptide-like helical domain superfamily [Dioscorea sansibarensis]